MKNGFILSWDSVIYHPLVGVMQPYRHAAWMWMLHEACRKKEGRDIYRSNGRAEILVREEYGQITHSERFIARALNGNRKKGYWTKDKVRTLLKQLENAQMIHQQVHQQIRYITICNFERYQNTDLYYSTSKSKTEPPASHQQSTTKPPNSNTVTGKHENKREGAAKDDGPTPAEIARKFFAAHNGDIQKGERYREYASRFPDASELNEFVKWWTEPSKSGKKQRWELQQTWELGRRIGTWLRKREEYQRNGRRDPEAPPIPRKHRLIGKQDDFGNTVADVEMIVSGRAWRYRTTDGRRFEWNEAEERYEEMKRRAAK